MEAVRFRAADELDTRRRGATRSRRVGYDKVFLGVRSHIEPRPEAAPHLTTRRKS